MCSLCIFACCLLSAVAMWRCSEGIFLKVISARLFLMEYCGRSRAFSCSGWTVYSIFGGTVSGSNRRSLPGDKPPIFVLDICTGNRCRDSKDENYFDRKSPRSFMETDFILVSCGVIRTDRVQAIDFCVVLCVALNTLCFYDRVLVARSDQHVMFVSTDRFVCLLNICAEQQRSCCSPANFVKGDRLFAAERESCRLRTKEC